MFDLKRALTASQLFSNFTEREISNMLVNTKYKIESYSKDQVIAIEGEVASSMGIVLEGNVEVQKSFPSGRNVTIKRMKQGDIFGEALIFSKSNRYPATVISVNRSKVLFLSMDDIVKTCSSNKTFLYNFLGALSNRILILSDKLKSLSYQTIRQQIADYLMAEYKSQNSLTITIPFSRKEMAEHFGTTRPSLSRELINMKKDGLIDINKNTITIRDLDSLEEALF
jgi:CRP-like cAMP-binding protein